MGMRNKTDRIDAAVIALYGLQREPAPTATPSQAERQLRKLHRLYGVLEKDHTAHKNRLHEVGEDKLVRTHIEEIVADLNSHIERIEKEMDQLIQSDKVLNNDYKLLKTIKGIGPKTARLLLAELGDLRKFSRKEIVAFVGLYPKLFQSGSSVHKQTRLAKGGGAIIRRNLYLCAMSAKKHDAKLNAFFNRKVDNGLCKKAAVVAVMRKLILIARAVVVSGQEFIPDYA